MEEKRPAGEDFNPLLPFYIQYYHQDHLPDSWHPEAELFFLLSGSARILINGHSFSLQSEDVVLVNANDVREISGSSWEALVLSFREEMLPQPKQGQRVLFDLCSGGNTFSTRYDYIRYCLALLVEQYKKKDQLYRSLSVFYALYDHLTANFSAPPSTNPEAGLKRSERLFAILSYINSHYKDNLSLSETAAAFHLSPPYFSAFFRKNTGKTFLDYYNDVRLNHAVRDLLFTSDSIESIAQSSGFGDPRSFTSLFKKRYGTLPNAYRKIHSPILRKEKESGEARPEKAVKTGSIPSPESLTSLSRYTSVFQKETDFVTALNENPRIIDAGKVSFLSPQQTLTHNYHNMICIGSAKQLFYREIQDMLIRTQKEIRFHYVKFHGLLSDDMMVYTEDREGKPHYSFTFVDKALDFLLSIGLRPLCQLSFMPIALAEDPSRLVDFYHFNTSPPRDLQKWCDLIDALVRHFVSRYGLEEVKSWPFCVWNEPDETIDQFSWGDRRRFFDFYEKTFRVVKNVSPDLIFGTPSLLISLQKDYAWSDDFFRYVKEHDCEPDFLNIHYYDNSIFEEDSADRYRGKTGFSAENMEVSFPLTADPYAFVKFISNIKNLLRRHNRRNLPVYLTEWNLTISHRDLINDTCFKSCHLVKNLLDNYDRLSSFSYWCLTDLEEELQIAEDLYHGGLGLFTYNGIPKANYNAFLLLGKLGNGLLKKGDGFFITRSENRIAVMLYNYEHYSRLFAAGQRTEKDYADRYSPFEEMSTAQFSVQLTDLPGSNAMIREYYVNQQAGSSYDVWARMGSVPLRSAEEYELLMKLSSPGLYLHSEAVENGVLSLHIRMAPLEVRLVEIEIE